MFWRAFAGAVAILLTGLGSVAHAERSLILHLTNGDRITGALVSEDADHVVIHVWGSDLTVPVSEINEREERPAPSAEALAIEAPTVSEAETIAATKTAPEEVEAQKPRRWRGEAQFGLDVGVSENRRQLYHARIKASYTRQRFRNIFDYNAAYGKTDDVLSANRMDGSSKSELELTDRLYAYSLLGGGYDQIRKIDLRYEAGPGVGYHLIQRTNLVLDIEAGMTYEAQHRTDGTDVKRFFYRLAEQLTWRISDRVTFDEKLEFFPQAEDLGNFRIRFESNLSYALRKNLFFNLAVLNLYDSQPARDVSKNDLQIRSSIGVKF